MKVTFILLAVLLVLLLAAHLALLLWKERDSIRSAYWRWRGKPARDRVAAEMTDADRRAAALTAKEQQNFMDYDGDEQPEIDVDQFIWE